MIFLQPQTTPFYTVKEPDSNIRCFIILLQQFQMENQPQPMPPTDPVELPQRSFFQFSQPREPNIFFDSKFDSGNMNRVVRTAYDHYSIWTASDAQGTPNEGYPKSWFYFATAGFIDRKVAFSIHRVHFLFAMIKRPHLYRPVYRVKYANEDISVWDRLPYPVLSLALNEEEELVLKFDFIFTKNIERVEFAFGYPYGYEKCRDDLEQIRRQYESDKDLFFGQYELTKSYEGRVIDLLLVTSHEGREGFEPVKDQPFSEQKIARFRSNKPVVFISARVHPIETPSSFCLLGLLKFLLDKKDMRAFLLRRYFVFALVPMLNPDGVARGHCRMDALNQNLNRYYDSPDPVRQPSCFAVKKLCQLYSKDKRLFMYLDLHAHPAFKGNFIFGNAIYEFVEQVESQLFPKILARNCINFQFEQCVFSRKHMKAKDRNEEISKEGCARVVFYKELGLVHSYTLECGYHMNSYDNVLQPQKKIEGKYVVRFKVNDRGEKIYQLTEKLFDEEKLSKYREESGQQGKQWEFFEYKKDALDDLSSEYYKKQIQLFTPQAFENLGRNILISLLDVWNKNPYSRLDELAGDRRQIAEKQSKLDRFRKEQAGIKTKQKRIVELIEEQLYGEWHKRNVLNPLLTTTQQKDKKRNYTLQNGKLVGLRSQQAEKSYKQDKGTISENMAESDSHIPAHLKGASLGPQKHRQEKGYLNAKEEKGGDGLVDNKSYYPRTFKVGRGKQTNSAGQNEKEAIRAPSIGKDVIGTQIKITLEEQLARTHKHQAMSLSSKVIKNPGFGALNMRVRNVVMGGFGPMLPSRK